MPIIAVAMLIQAGVSLAGMAVSAEQEASARRLLREAQARFGRIDQPALEAVAAETLGPSEAGAVTGDPRMKSAQMAALSKLQALGDSGGLDLADNAAINQVTGQLARRDSAGRASLMNSRAARGLSSSGDELAMALHGQQSSNESAADFGSKTLGQAQRRALEAMISGGQLAGNIRNQDFGENFRTAQARDEISKYNASARERAATSRNDVAQRQYQNAMDKATAMNTGLYKESESDQAGAQRTRNTYSAAGAAGTAAAQDYAAWKRDHPDAPPPEDDDNYGELDY